MRGSPARGREAHAAGLRAEALAALLLRLKGYRILARRMRTKLGEIDLVARRGRMLAFVEVKARPDLDSAGTAITSRNAHRISRASNMLFARFGSDCAGARIDAVLVTPGRLPRHIEGAWIGV